MKKYKLKKEIMPDSYAYVVLNVFEEIDTHDGMLIDLLWSKSRIMRMSKYLTNWVPPNTL